MSEKIGRNDPCPCGSGKKFKACCWKNQQGTPRKTFSAKPLSGTGQSVSQAFSKFVPSTPKKDEESS
jgi:hypothetical protein